MNEEDYTKLISKIESAAEKMLAVEEGKETEMAEVIKKELAEKMSHLLFIDLPKSAAVYLHESINDFEVRISTLQNAVRAQKLDTIVNGVLLRQLFIDNNTIYPKEKLEDE